MPIKAVDSYCKAQMAKAIDYLKDELRGIRGGQASAGLVEHLKVEVPSYGSTMELRELASISIPEPNVILIKPFDPATNKDIERALRTSDIGITPMTDGKTIRLPVPPLSGERRKQLVNQIKKLGEAQKVAVRNLRRDSNKQIEAAEKDKKITEDEATKAKDDIQSLLKKTESEIDHLVAHKTKEVETI